MFGDFMNGKGSKRRPKSVSQEIFDKNWEKIFGKKKEEKDKKNFS